MVALKLLIGLALLIFGAEFLVRGASRISAALKISPLIIGLTVVAFGTSSPELVVSLTASMSGNADIALGNVVGSNIFNVLFILGLSALITPLVVSQQLVRLDVPIMIAVSTIMLIMSIDGVISPIDGFILFSGLIAYTTFLIKQGRKENKGVQLEYSNEYSGAELSTKAWSSNIILVVVGLITLVLGSNLLVESAITIARIFGLSELLIGLTIIAAGTSMPEVATSITASIKGERDIAVGNIVGSNIFNILAVVGLSSTLSKTGITVPGSAFAFDFPIMIAVALACLPIFLSGHKIARWEGALFFFYYLAYITYIALTTTKPASLEVFRISMIWFALPITMITLLVLSARLIRDRSKQESLRT